MRLPESETRLVRLAAQCSDEAFAALVERHRPRLRLIAKRFSETREDQEDLTQETIGRLLDRQKKPLRDWQPIAPFAAYLTTIASRRGLRFAEERSRLPGRTLRSLPPGSPLIDENLLQEVAASADGDPHQHLESTERSEIIHHAVARLSDRDQLLIRFRFFEELGFPEIARLMGLSHGAARKAVFDALRRLERLLDPHAEAIFPQF